MENKACSPAQSACLGFGPSVLSLFHSAPSWACCCLHGVPQTEAPGLVEQGFLFHFLEPTPWCGCVALAEAACGPVLRSRLHQPHSPKLHYPWAWKDLRAQLRSGRSLAVVGHIRLILTSVTTSCIVCSPEVLIPASFIKLAGPVLAAFGMEAAKRGPITVFLS